jgi:hypothetical protein
VERAVVGRAGLPADLAGARLIAVVTKVVIAGLGPVGVWKAAVTSLKLRAPAGRAVLLRHTRPWYGLCWP